MSAPVDSKLYLNLHQQIVEERSSFKAKHQDDIKIFDEEIRKRGEEGKPLLDIEKLDIEEMLLNEFLQHLLSLLKRHELFNQAEIDKFIDGKEKINLRQLIHPIINGDLKNIKSFSDQLDVGTDLLFFISLNLSQAVLELYSSKLKQKIDQESWLKGNCPVCGNYPAIEKLRKEDGRRILRCGFCGTEWHHKRIMCPFCGNEDHNSLRYFFIDEDSTTEKSAFRVDVCDKCKRYIKTLDERKLPQSEKPDLYLENLNTIYLDVLAQRDGYKSPTYWMVAPSEDLFV